MRRRGNVDLNQSVIVQTLRDSGHSVVSLAGVGNGCPDLLIARSGVYLLVELKSPKETSHKRDKELRLTQKLFREEWKAPIAVCETAMEVIEEMNERIRCLTK